MPFPRLVSTAISPARYRALRYATAVHTPRLCGPQRSLATEAHHQSSEPSAPPADFQKTAKRALKERSKSKATGGCFAASSDWTVTCGLEIHAQLNTTRKLFSDAATSTTAPPNTHISPIDASLPGTQPTLNPKILLRALQAALVLNCTPAPSSRFDRKHYFYWDQPAGYQLTQFYSPLALHGKVVLSTEDGVPEPLEIGIRQVQIEQDTGKTLSAPPFNLVDLNRVGVPLVEIITDPFPLPSADVAAKVVAKLQGLLRAVDACVIGMEWGGLRADVNVSVALTGAEELGQRCEIKNLSSFKAIEDAISAEAKRQIAMLEGGEVVQGETRGWDAETSTTHRLRGKEGEVDYRFMPEPDLAAVVLSKEVVEKVRAVMPPLPETLIEALVGEYGLSSKDSRTLLALDDGRTANPRGVVSYLRETTQAVVCRSPGKKPREVGKFVGNWLLHELGGHLSAKELSWEQNPVDRPRFIEFILMIMDGRITGSAAKKLIPIMMTSDEPVSAIVEREGLGVKPLTEEEMIACVQAVLTSKGGSDVVAQIQAMKLAPKKTDEKKKKGLRGFVVGSVMRQLSGRVQASQVEAAVDEALRKI